MNDLSFIFSIVIKILNIYVFFFKKRFKRILKNKRSSGAWENLELRLWLQLQGNHGSRGLQLQGNHGSRALRLWAPAPGPWFEEIKKSSYLCHQRTFFCFLTYYTFTAGALDFTTFLSVSHSNTNLYWLNYWLN